MKKAIKLIGILAMGCGLLAAQEQPATARQPDGSTRTATTRQDNAPRKDNWGWLGLLGLAGLAGLKGRRDNRAVAEDDRSRVRAGRVA
jgi:MYXO-CTERM domain-containing protein